jgi:predicted DNA-binding protein (MmcQ/YjbR family)
MDDFLDHLDDYSPAIADLAVAARDLVLSVQPDAHVEFTSSWGGYLVFKRVADAGSPVCWLGAAKKHVSLGFSDGPRLPDPEGLLEGTGKHSRQLKLKSPADLQRPAVRALLQAAWAAQPEAAELEEALLRVRGLCLALPETSEQVSHGHPTFCVGPKTFAKYGGYSPSVAFKADMGLHEELKDDPRIFPTPYMAKNGWLSVRLDGETDWKQVERFVRHSYRHVAPKKLALLLEGPPGKDRK